MNAGEYGPPEDIASFWLAAADEALDLRLDYRRSISNDFDYPGFTVESLSFRSVGDRTVHGWIAYPPGARRLPAFVWVPPYGQESLTPDAYGTRKGFVSLSLNLHGHGPFHRERYSPDRGYFAQGAEEPETWVFRRMFQDAVVATRVLQAQTEADEDRIGSMGMSQGGGMALWLGAWCPIVRAVCADMPFLGNIGRTLQQKVYRYPLKELADFMEALPLGTERVLNTVSYFDTAHQAAYCHVPTHVSLGRQDPACRPDTVQAIFQAIPAEKHLEEYGGGHDWHVEMVENNRNWLLSRMNG
jgi:cephalosporin-C deacetylase